MSSESIKATRVMIAATASGKGKTTITTGLLSLLKEAGYAVHSFKCGPDYIDPMYHEAVLGVPSKNLDPFFCDEDLLRASFIYDVGDINIIEGCMGLYDGMSVTSENSPYTVATYLKCPIILVVDGQNKGYSIIPEILGFIQLDVNKLIKGIFINQISDNYFDRIAPVIEKETGLKVVGHLRKLTEDTFDSRHLGLKSIQENNAIEKINSITNILKDTVNIDCVIEIASNAQELLISKRFGDYIEKDCLRGEVVAIAQDEAFNFYYKDNIRLLELSGAKIKYFSPIHDAYIPEEATMLYIGGGYPENHLIELSSNESMKKSVYDFIESGHKAFAECGGFMYLQSSIEGQPMVGVFNNSAYNTGKLVRFGYVEAVYSNKVYKGHEFHHYDVANPGTELEITKASTGNKYRAGLKYKNCLASFCHFYFVR